MAYLAAFHWGWLLASLLLGFAMGWIAVVHRGPGAFDADVPYILALGQLTEQPRACNVLANLVAVDPDDVRIGMPIKIGYVDIPDEHVTMYQWLPR